MLSVFSSSSKCSLFHNSNLFGSCISHILYTECAKIKKIIPALKVKEELNDLYCSPNIVRVIKCRRMRWAGHVACMGEERVCV